MSRVCAALATVLVVVGCVVGFVVGGNEPAAAAEGEFASPAFDAKAVAVKGNNEFALDLYAKLSEQPVESLQVEREGNLFFSPYSVSTALAMTYAGARGNTGAEMAKVLHLGANEKPLHAAFGELVRDLNAPGKKRGYELSVANALWAQKDYRFLPEFTELVTKSYDAGLNKVNFSGAAEDARKTINKWVEDQTRDKIKELLKPGVVDSATRLVLTNAIYFKGTWQLQFKKDRTKDEPFTLLDGKKVDVPMMRQTARFGYMETDGFQALVLPYAGREVSAVILLPKKADGISELEKELTDKNLEEWLAKLLKESEKPDTEVEVYLPKFQMTSEFKLGPVLSAMGMKDAFVYGAADFSGMDGTKELFISAVVHKAFVDVNEEGTEAAAATAVVAAVKAAPPRIAVFRADHPFVFLIRDNRTGSILFMGRVMNPKE